MSTSTLIRYSGLAAIMAGALRITTSFLPATTQPDVTLELLYLVIDVLLLLGIIGIYAYQHERVGKLGLIGFLLALIGTALITGPDGALGGVDIYMAGSLIISIGLSVFALAVWRANSLPHYVPILWLLSTVVGVGGFLLGNPPLAFILAGDAFGLAFIGAGIRLWSMQRTGSE